MVIKYLALKTVEVSDDRISQEGGVIHSQRDSEAWRAYFELKEREKGLLGKLDAEIPPDMEGHYFL
jgi:hypothetical protein